MNGRLFLFAGGGTGGHIAPGIAVAEELREREPECRIRFVGSGRPIEERMIGPTGFELSSHEAAPLSDLRRRPISFVKSHWNSYRDARRMMREDNPAAVIGLGGFASVPLVTAAQKERIPALLLEQNVLPGRANRWLSRRIPICTSFDRSSNWLKRRTVVHVTGNPLRREYTAQHALSDAPDNSRTSTLLVLGGSHGSRQINDLVLNAVDELRDELKSWRIIHQTGVDDSDRVRTRYQQIGIDATVEPFFDSLSDCYRQATLAVCRAGASTLTELAIVGLPSILIPHPFAAEDHQSLNAAYFADAEAAIHLVADDVSGEFPLATALKHLIDEPQQIESMSRAMSILARPDAASAVASLVQELSAAR